MSQRRGPNQFSAWLSAAMQARGLRQKHVAEMTGVDPVQVMRWRRGEAIPSPQYLTRLASVFEIDEAELQRLAWSRSNHPDSPQSIDLERQRYRARYDYLMQNKIPKPFWEPFLEACEALAAVFTNTARGQVNPDVPDTLNPADEAPLPDEPSSQEPPLIHCYDHRQHALRNASLAPAG